MSRVSLIFLTLHFLFALRVSAQESGSTDTLWKKVPSGHELTAKELEEPYVYLFNNKTIEYPSGLGLRDEMIVTTHYRIRINGEKAVNTFNKVYVPLKGTSEILELKARTITNQGDIIEVDEKNMKEVENLEDKGTYKMFALEGVQKGSDVEVLYAISKPRKLYGNVYLHDNYLIKSAVVKIISPLEYIFTAKPYNFEPEVQDTILNDKHHLIYYYDSVPGYKAEKYADYVAGFVRLEYKFSYHTDQAHTEHYSWDAAARQLYTVFCNATGKERRNIKKLTKQIGLENKQGEQQIIKAEKWLKREITIRNDLKREKLTDVSASIEEKTARPDDMVKLYTLLFDHLDIDHRLVITTDRTKIRFDKDFISWHYLNDYLVYFPAYDSYLAPTNMAYRYDMYPHIYMDNDALFLKPVNIGNIQTAVAEIKTIPGCTDTGSYVLSELDVRPGEQFATTTIHAKYTLAGYSAMFIQPYYFLLNDEQKEEAINSFTKRVGPDTEILEQDVIDYNHEIPPDKLPFVIKSKCQLSSLTEHAGKNYLFRIGQLIGEQVEMYQEEDRQSDIAIPFPHQLIRKIRFHIPEGYEIKGLDALEIDKQYPEGEEKTMGFVSGYNIEDNTLIVTVEEYYKNIRYPLSQYSQFREIINTAADFNKIVVMITEAK